MKKIFTKSLKINGFPVLVSLLVSFCFSFSTVTNAQQRPMYSQYMFNHLAINPAYAGSHEVFGATFLAREQWVGLEGAPSTQTFSVQSPIKLKNVGVGMVFSHDRIGVTSENSAYLSYSYKTQVTDRALLRLGVHFGVNHLRSAFTEARIFDETDEFFTGELNDTNFNLGFGFIYERKKFYLSASAPLLLENSLFDELKNSQSKQSRHYFISSGYIHHLSPEFVLKPHMLIKYVEGAPVEFDANLSLHFRRIIGLGVSWRSLESIDALFELQITEQLKIGYSYDFFTTTDLREVQKGSHELMLQYLFKFGSYKVISPRYF